MNVDERALRVLTEWNGQKYQNEGQKAASLQCLIISALREQDRDTRHACAEAITNCEAVESDNRVRRDEAMGACINVKAV